MEKAILIGRITKDPEIKTYDGGQFAVFSIACEHVSKGQKVVQFHNISAFGKLGELASQFKKGALVMVEADIRYRKSDDKLFINYLAKGISDVMANSIKDTPE